MKLKSEGLAELEKWQKNKDSLRYSNSRVSKKQLLQFSINAIIMDSLEPKDDSNLEEHLIVPQIRNRNGRYR